MAKADPNPFANAFSMVPAPGALAQPFITCQYVPLRIYPNATAIWFYSSSRSGIAGGNTTQLASQLSIAQNIMEPIVA